MIEADKAMEKMNDAKQERQNELYDNILKEADSAIEARARHEKGWAEIPIFDLDEHHTEMLVREYAYNGYDVFMRLNLGARYVIFRWADKADDLPAGAVLRKKSLQRLQREFDEHQRAWQEEMDRYGVYCMRKTRAKNP